MLRLVTVLVMADIVFVAMVVQVATIVAATPLVAMVITMGYSQQKWTLWGGPITLLTRATYSAESSANGGRHNANLVLMVEDIMPTFFVMVVVTTAMVVMAI